VQTAEQMAEAVLKRLDDASIIVMAAAVADYQAARFSPAKMKKTGGTLTLELRPTRDILAEIAARRRAGQVVVGFAAETDHVLENAASKLRAKTLDLLVANDVTREGAGFDSDTNIATLLFPDGRTEELQKMNKFDVANRVLDEIVRIRQSAR
ncbi:MAG: phosphopantothenoylcysteine decarboxylase, partial [Terriglobia bacterium]